MHVPVRLTFQHVLLAALALGAAEAARADDKRSLVRAPLPDAYRQECGACHVPYPPRLLAAAVFQRPAIGTAANCAACHAGADEGAFDEHGIYSPR